MADGISARRYPDMTLCESKVVHSYGYDTETAALFVRFVHGRKLYRYDNYPPDMYQALREAVSVGKFVSGRVVHNYPGEFIREQD
uniref:Putative RNA binding domain protein n=1 Tax=viral metagenome TaxID=1070528 RepID=A0A6M3KH50_9ZZZZ